MRHCGENCFLNMTMQSRNWSPLLHNNKHYENDKTELNVSLGRPYSGKASIFHGSLFLEKKKTN